MGAALDKLFSVSDAFDHPVTVGVLIGLGPRAVEGDQSGDPAEVRRAL